MSLIIEELDMPENCYGCWFYDDQRCYLYSQGIPSRYRYDASIKPKWCKLKEEIVKPVTRPLTNEYILNSMTIEEKAEFLKNTRFKNGGCPEGVCCRSSSCYECWLDWLEQEVDE